MKVKHVLMIIGGATALYFGYKWYVKKYPKVVTEVAKETTK
jgi:hypothetical protein